MSEQDVTLKDVEAAAEVLKGAVRLTSLDRSRVLSELSGMDLLLKMENTQRTGSFKLRGAYNKIHSLSDSERQRGVVAASAGNHAQGVAHAATLLDTKSTIVMPEGASPAKVDATKGYGARVILHGKIFDETLEMAKKVAEKEGSIFVHPFDDPKVIAGQGTVGLEMLDSAPELETIVVPVGGGGLISGIAVAVKAIKPKVKVIGVQSQAFPGMYMAFKTARIVPFKAEETIADGIAVKQPGKLDYKLVRKLVDDVVLVSDEDIAEAIFVMLERIKTVAEPAGAAGVGACLAGVVRAPAGPCGIVVSGGNIDMYTLDQIVAKGLEREHRLLRVKVTLSDKPGALKDILDVVALSRANVVKVEHDRVGKDIPIGRAEVTLTLETQNMEHTKSLISALSNARLKYKLVN
ncbi:MAG: threonine ammonia-lyase [Nitrososphaerota archaeon]|nr:threonine ammonia-lyase [Nitrososphaerota archaeon]